MRSVKLSEIFRVGSSKRVLKADWKDSGVPFFRGREITRLSKYGVADNELFISEAHFKDLSSKFGVPVANDIMITAIGTIGNTYIVKANDRFYFKDASVLWLHKLAEVDSRFVNYWLKSELFFEQLDRGNGATVDSLTIERLSNVEILLPPLEIQVEIVKRLDKAFNGIEESIRITSSELQLLDSCFDSFLNGILYVQIANCGTSRLVDVLDIARGGSPRPIDKFLTDDPSGVNWIKISDATSSKKYITSTVQRIVPSGVSRSRIVNPGDFLLSNSMSFGRPYIMGTTGCIHDGWLVLSNKKQLLNQDYLYYVLSSKYIYEQFNRTAAGSTVRNLNISLAGQVAFPVPSLQIQEEIVAKIESFETSIDDLRKSLSQKLANLSELKLSLLSGSFDVNHLSKTFG